jgi:hypothetical protein
MELSYQRHGLVLVLTLFSSAAVWQRRSLSGFVIPPDAGAFGTVLYDPAWETGRVIIFPTNLRVTQECLAPPGSPCQNCSFEYTPDATVLFFSVGSAVASDRSPIALSVMEAANVSAELLNPDATIYVPPRDCRPPLVISYGGSWVNTCTPGVRPFFRPESPWCFTPAYATHILRLDTLTWSHFNATGADTPISSANAGSIPLFGFGVSARYDALRDRVLLTGAVLAPVTGIRGFPGNCLFSFPGMRLHWLLCRGLL